MASWSGPQLPKIKAPSLEGIEVDVLAPRLPEAKDLIRRLEKHLHDKASRREREVGEQTAGSDDIEVDLLVFADGVPIASGVQRSLRCWLQQLDYLPGLTEELVGMQVGSAKMVALDMPADSWLDELAAKSLSVYVELKKAWQVEPCEVEDEARLQAAGLGDSLKAALELMADEIDSEQGEELMLVATQTVLAAVAARVTEEVDDELVDIELKAIWNKGPGELLAQPDFDPRLSQVGLQGFLANPSLRSQARERLKINLAMAALIEEENLTPSEEVMDTLIESAATLIGLGADKVRQSLATNKLYATEAVTSALYLTAVGFIMARAKVNVIDEEEPVPA